MNNNSLKNLLLGRKKGRIAWNKGLKTGIIPKTAFQKGHIPIGTGKSADWAKDNPQIFKKGHTPWNKGIGDKTSKEKRAKNDIRHKEWRTKVFIRDNYTCQECGKRSGNGKRNDIQADHIKAFILYKDLRYEVSNGRTLCIECHKKTPTFGGKILKLPEYQLIKNNILIKT